MMSPDDIDKVFKIGGVTGAGVLLFNVLALMKGWLVPAKTLDREIRRGDLWQERAWEFHKTTRESMTVAKEAVLLSEKVIAKKVKQ